MIDQAGFGVLYFARLLMFGGEMRRWVAIARLVGIGWYIAICIIVGLGGGLWLDRLLGTRLIFTLVGLILGIIVAFWGMYKMLLPVMEIEQDEDRENQ